MCGIAGFVLREGVVHTSAVRLMCQQIRHRGPDDEGYFADGRCALGMRRLKIIDLETGHQPITNEDGTLWVVFNGEIYNYRELRNELRARGHVFRTESDTEALVHLFEDEGVDGIKRLRGMFAFAVWDQRRERLTLVRDRMGKKPLYYASTAQGFWFGSELKSLRAAPISLNVDRDSLRLYFQFGYVPEPATAYREVRKVEAGSFLEVSSRGPVHSGRYWKVPQPAEEAEGGLTEGDAAAEVRRVFDEAVRMRMIADVPVGAFLSGGIDSSSVVASMALQSELPVKTFSIGFAEASHDELPAARLVAREFKTEHHEFVVRPEAVELITAIIPHFDEPFADSSAIPTYLVSQMAAEQVKVALTGDGGDELFAGYESLFQAERAERYDRIPLTARALIRMTADRLPYSFYGKNFLKMVSRPNVVERYFDLNYAPFYMRQALLQEAWQLPADSAYLLTAFPDSIGAEGGSALSRLAHFEATTQLTSDMLFKVDRMSMANSLEVRCPLLDHELAEVAMRIPHRWKMKDGRGKQIFLKAVGSRLPAELLRLPKKGFAVPLAHWFRTSLKAFVFDHLTSRSFLERGFVSEAFLRHMLSEHEQGRRDNHHWLWMLLVLELWCREFAEANADLAAIAG